MPLPDQSTIKNRLLALLPSDDFAHIANHLEPVELPKGFVIVRADQRIEHVYFPASGIGSVLTVSPGGHQAEAGMFGREGFSPTPAGVGGLISIHEVLMQVEGAGYRVPIGTFMDVLGTSQTLANMLARFIQAFAAQVSFTALANAVYQVDERLARWLLMCHDRVDSDEIFLTHEFISLTLAVRRPSVTTALHIFEGKGLIKSQRGKITVRDRAGLHAFAGDAYGKPEEEYRRLFGDI